jgi:3-hydroxyisobutyrate dehydrogenase-like beta-hydroxyacid dehydrogenase
MGPTVVIIAPGEMGSGIGRRLHERGTQVRTSLRGRSAASAARAAEAGLEAIDDDGRLVADADFMLSILPPGDALGLARRLAPALAASPAKPVYVDCNAVSPETVAAVAEVITPTGCRFADVGIIGGPPAKDDAGPRLYASGAAARELLRLGEYGLDIRVLAGAVGVASALKMSYAALTKGLTAIGAALMEGAMHAGVAPALRREFAASQPMLAQWLERQVPRMYPKAYRWVAEMEEIGRSFEADPGARQIYVGAARLYERLAQANEHRGAPGNPIDLLDAFLDQ